MINLSANVDVVGFGIGCELKVKGWAKPNSVAQPKKLNDQYIKGWPSPITIMDE